MSGLPASPLSEIFGSSSSADLIVFLVYNHDRDYWVQDLADRLKVSKAKASKMKEGLLKHGVIQEPGRPERSAITASTAAASSAN